MTGHRFRGPILIPLLLIAFGVAVLLVNFGVLDARETWHLALRGWPIVIVLLGIDLLLSRASAGRAFGVLVLACVIAAAAFAAVHIAAPARWTTETFQVHEPLPAATAVEITAACSDCSMALSAGASRDRLIEGSVEARRLDRFVRTSKTEGPAFALELRSQPRLPFSLHSLRDRPAWNLRVADDIAMTLSLSGARCDVDLGGTSVDTLYVQAEEQASIRLSGTTSCTAYVTAETARIEVPDGIGVVVEGTGAVGQLVVPDGYTRGASSATSPGADAASVRTRVVILPGAEHVEVATGATGSTP